MKTLLLKAAALARRLGTIFVALVAPFAAVWVLLPRPPLLPPGAQFSREVLDRDGRLLHLTLTPDGKYRLPAKLAKISPELVTATLAMEDRNFYTHPGANPCSLLRALWGAATGQRLGGGSTISMQYARLRWGLKTRSWSGKAVQVFRAIQLERHYSKREILESYFTFAPYGGNVEGVQAASLLWCGKSASALSLRESVALAVLPQRPTARRPREGNTAAAAPQARLMARLREARGESPDPLDAEFSLHPVVVPRLAPHLSRHLLTARADTAVIRSTLDRAQQQAVERSIADFLERWHSRGLRNAAAILVHAPTREVRSWVGSADFFDTRIFGQVDGALARRSPGSALKPFIYALAFDQGIIHPRTLLDDAPHRFAGYNPENSDRGFLGPIPASEALRRSRNVPAVELAAKLRGPGLDGFLRTAGVQLTRSPETYGLSLALGSAEVTLEELAMLYASLATDGIARPLRTTLDVQPASTDAPALLSPAARWLTLEALRGEPGFAAPARLSWKTGTSHGFRDAWACGVIGDWVLCVWVGNFDGTSMPGLFARDTAAPLLFQTATRLGLHASPAARPRDVTEVSICADSGLLAGPHCPHLARTAFIAGVSPIAVCDVHREIILSDGRHEVREFWPAHRLEQFRRAGLPRAAAPVAKTDAGPAPRIVSPQPALTYVLRRGETSKNTIPLEADAAPGVQRVHWFAGARYLGAAAPAHPLAWHPEPGRWILQALDDFGRTARVAVTVSME